MNRVGNFRFPYLGKFGFPLTVDSLRAWALAVQGRTNHNKATCALANKIARICYACLRDQLPLRAGQTAGKEDRSQRLPDPGLIARGCIAERAHPTIACVETDRPSWHPGSPPHRMTPITPPAEPLLAAHLPVATIGASVLADSMSARATQSPLTMPDIRLQALPSCQIYRSASSLLGGVHIRWLGRG